jgi:putative ABC transport system permease protein
MNERLIYNFRISADAVINNGMRSALTALGIIFGVAAVICMMAIGNGARQEVMELIEQVGANNIIIIPDEKASANSSEIKSQSPGLSLDDSMALTRGLENARNVCPEVSYDVKISAKGHWLKSQVLGITPEYVKLYGLDLVNERQFSHQMIENHMPVCIIGYQVKSKLFPHTDPIGKHVKCGHVWLKVIDVLKPGSQKSEELASLGVSSFGSSVLVPIETLLLRYRNNALITKRDFSQEDDDDDESPAQQEIDRSHQLSKIVVQVENSEQLASTVKVIRRILMRLHNNSEDFKIVVPELQLKEQEQTKRVFNFVLLAIAAISLLIGGIGIMNIMLASVMERVREIGIRLSLGARQQDIRLQFMFEATIMSLVGGLIGIGLGIALSFAVEMIFEIKTIISMASVLISFSVSAAVGIVFGYLPARKASENDPVISLRHD